MTPTSPPNAILRASLASTSKAPSGMVVLLSWIASKSAVPALTMASLFTSLFLTFTSSLKARIFSMMARCSLVVGVLDNPNKPHLAPPQRPSALDALDHALRLAVEQSPTDRAVSALHRVDHGRVVAAQFEPAVHEWRVPLGVLVQVFEHVGQRLGRLDALFVDQVHRYFFFVGFGSGGAVSTGGGSTGGSAGGTPSTATGTSDGSGIPANTPAFSSSVG